MFRGARGGRSAIITNNTFLRRTACIALALFVAGCAPRPPVSRAPVDELPSVVPADAVEYRLVPGESEIRILAYRDGPLASLGHNHVISTTDIDGTLALASPVSRSTVRLAFPVQSLKVDIPAQRAEEGADFATELDQSAIDGTRANMLGEKLLDAANFPEVSLRNREVRGELPALQLLMEVKVRDQVTLVEIPVTVTSSPGQLVAAGAVTVRQTDLGLQPFSVGLGALSVRDELELKFRLVARTVGQ